jgi:hypothetical protein
VKSSGRDETVWVIVHIHMEATLGISLYSYLYLKLAKNTVFLVICCFLFYKTVEKSRFCLEAGDGDGVIQIMYTYVSKCENDKKKDKKIECFSLN